MKKQVSLLMLLPVAASAQQRPNIVYIMTDDHTAQMLSAYGNSPIQTPNLDRLASEGVLFRHSYVANSLSGPSRACMLTGKHSHKNGFTNNEHGVFDGSQQTMPKLMRQAGYQTALIGKWHLVSQPTGFDYYEILHGQGEYYNPTFIQMDGSRQVAKGYCTDIVTDKAIDWMEHRDQDKPFILFVHHKACHRDWLPPMKYLRAYEDQTFPLPGNFWDNWEGRVAAQQQEMTIGSAHDMDIVYDNKIYRKGDSTRLSQAYLNNIKRLDEADRRVYDQFYDSITTAFYQNPPTGRALTEYKFQRYMRDYAKVTRAMDDNVGRLMDYLREHDMLDNTLVIYTSDQGFYMGEHGWFDKRFMYEESFRTPLIVSYPKHIKEGSNCNQMVQNIDFAPTFLDLAGLEKPKYMPGTSLQPLFAGQPVKKWRNSLYYHYYDYPNYHLVRKHDGVRTERYKLIHFYGKGGENAVQENKYQRQPGTTEYNCFQYLKSINYITQDAEVDYYELYDIKADPTEMHNLYGQPGMQKVEKEMKKLLATYRKNLKVDE